MFPEYRIRKLNILEYDLYRVEFLYFFETRILTKFTFVENHVQQLYKNYIFLSPMENQCNVYFFIFMYQKSYDAIIYFVQSKVIIFWCTSLKIFRVTFRDHPHRILFCVRIHLTHVEIHMGQKTRSQDGMTKQRRVLRQIKKNYFDVSFPYNGWSSQSHHPVTQFNSL